MPLTVWSILEEEIAVSFLIGKPRKMSAMSKHEALWGLIFVIPGVLGVLVFTAFPMLMTFAMSFASWNVATSPRFVGLSNFRELSGDLIVRREFLNTLYYAFGSVPVLIAVSCVIANFLNSKIRGLTVYRTIFFLPYICMAAAIASVWQWILNSRYGVVNQIMAIFDLPQIRWMSDPKLVMPVIIFISVWSSVGYNMIILLAALQNISTTYYEAASIDGAGPVRRFLNITVPLMSPTIFFLFIVSFIGSFKAFDIIYMVIGGVGQAGSGGPLANATRTVVFGIYERGLYFMRMGYASAEAVVLFVLIMTITGIQFIAQKKWVYYE
jgi:multiple sugar transport system permease protein